MLPFLSITSAGGRIGRIVWSNTTIRPHHAVPSLFRYDTSWRTAWGWIHWHDSWPSDRDPRLLERLARATEAMERLAEAFRRTGHALAGVFQESAALGRTILDASDRPGGQP